MKIPKNAEKHCTALSCPERRSICCKAKSEAVSGNEGTGYFRCKSCKNEFIGEACTAGEVNSNYVQVGPEVHCLVCHLNVDNDLFRDHIDSHDPLSETSKCTKECGSYFEGVKSIVKATLNKATNPCKEEEKEFTSIRINEEREKIRTDLLKIADEGEYEDLRREVEIYFKLKVKPDKEKIGLGAIKGFIEKAKALLPEYINIEYPNVDHSDNCYNHSLGMDTCTDDCPRKDYKGEKGTATAIVTITLFIMWLEDNLK